ncbi:hypothetical protein DI43_19055 [Geobacillus sp. CAMR12739]|nr:hypothetical protein DI43_19055 [Geobacillus sp. CAMR12739]
MDASIRQLEQDDVHVWKQLKNRLSRRTGQLAASRTLQRVFGSHERTHPALKDAVNAGLIQTIEMTGQRIVIQLGRMEPGTDEFLQVDRVPPLFQVNEGFPAVKHIVENGLNGIVDSSLALRIDGNEMVNRLGETQFF